jgi:WD40 repeat protein
MNITFKYFIVFCFTYVISTTMLLAQQTIQLGLNKGHSERVKSVSFSEDNQFIISKSLDEVKYWDIRTGHEIKTVPTIQRKLLIDEKESYRPILSGDDNKYEMLLNNKNEGLLWDREQQKIVYTVKLRADKNLFRILSKNGKFLLNIGSYKSYKAENNMIKEYLQDKVEIWDIHKGELIKTIDCKREGYEYTENQIFWSKISLSEKYLFLKNEDRSYSMYDLSTNQIKWIYNLETQGNFRYCAFSNDNKSVLFFLNDIIEVRDVETGMKIDQYNPVPNKAITYHELMKNDMLLLSYIQQDSLHNHFIWDLKTRKTIQNFSTKLMGSFSSDLKYYVNTDGKVINLYSTFNKKKVKEIKSNYATYVGVIDLTKDGKVIAIGGAKKENYFDDNNQMIDSLIRVINLSTGEFDILRGHSDIITTLSFQTDTLLMSGSSDRSIYVWNLKNFGKYQKFKGHRDKIVMASFFDNGKKNNIKCWLT